MAKHSYKFRSISLCVLGTQTIYVTDMQGVVWKREFIEGQNIENLLKVYQRLLETEEVITSYLTWEKI